MALTKEQIEKMDAALGKKASSPAQYAQRSNAAYTGGLSQDKFSQMDRLLTKRIVASRPSSKKEEEEKDALGRSTKWYKNPIGALSRTFVEPVVKTLAKPFGEVVASSYELAGKEAPQWTEANRLASPELRSLKYGLGTDEQRAEMERLRQSGAQGAGFTDVLNVASLLPAGGLAKVAGGTGLLSKTARVLPKGIVGKGVETGADILKGAAKSEGLLKNAWTATKAAAPAGTGWGAAYGLASGLDERKGIGETTMSTLGGAATGLALGTGFAVAGAGIGRAFQKVYERVNADAKAAAIARKNTGHFAEIESKYGAVQSSVEQAKKTGINPIEFSATYDLLPVVDREGNIRVDNTGGALERLDAMLSPHEETVRKNLVREGRNIKVTDLRPILEKSINESGLEGAALDNAYKKINAELRGLGRRADKDGYIPMYKVHDAKVSKYKTVDYTNEGSKMADKAIARGLKETIESNTKSINVKNINNDLAQLYAVREFLESLQNKKVKGGRLGKYFAQTVGSVIGSHFGPVGSIVGAEAGGAMRGQMLKSAFGKETGNIFKPSDELLRATELGKGERPYNPLQLPSPEKVKESELARKNSVISAPYEPKYGEQGYNSLGNRNTTQSTTSAPTMRGISRTVAQNTDIVQPTQSEIRARLIGEGKQGVYGKPLLGLPSPDKTKSGPAIPLRQATQIDRPANVIGGLGQKTKNAEIPLSQVEARRVDLNDPMSIEDEISRRIDEARQQYGTMADRRGAGARPRAVEDANGNFEFSTNTFNVNRAKKDMRTQADFYKAEMHEVLYNQDETFRKLVDAKDKLLEKRVNALSFKKQDEDFERSVNELFGITEDEIKNIQKAQEANKYAKPYEQPKSIAKTPATVTEVKSTPVESQKQSQVKTGLLSSKSPDAALMAEAKKYKTAKNLNADDRATESTAFDLIDKQEAALLQANKTRHGKIINTDDFRPLFKDIGYRGTNSAAVQEPSSYLANKAFDEALKNPEPFAVFTSGMSGSGKTSALKNVGGFQDVADNAAVILDSNLSSFDSAKKKIQKTINAGKEPRIFYVYRDPVEGFVNGVVKRMKFNQEEMGRIVPTKVIANNAIGSWEVARKLYNEGVKVKFIDNSLGSGNAIEKSMDAMMGKIKYPSESELTSILNAEAKHLFEQGQLTLDQYQKLVE